MGCHFLLQCMKVKSESEVAQSCPTLRDPVDCSLPGSSIHGIFQATVLEWGAIAFSAPLQLLLLIPCPLNMLSALPSQLPPCPSLLTYKSPSIHGQTVPWWTVSSLILPTPWAALHTGFSIHVSIKHDSSPESPRDPAGDSSLEVPIQLVWGMDPELLVFKASK